MRTYRPEGTEQSTTNTWLWLAVATGLLIIVGSASFVGGFFFAKISEGVPEIPVLSEVPDEMRGLGSVVDEVKDIIDREALRPSSESSQTKATIQGLLSSLEDTHAEYYDKRDYGFVKEQNEGSFVGIGVTLTERDGEAVIVTVFDNGPAKRAGIKPQDVILSVDGVAKKPWKLEDVVSRVRGPEGTKVALGIRRGKKTHKVTIERERIDIPNTESRMIGSDVGYIRLFSFTQPSARDIVKAIESLDKKGAKGYVLDLRHNPGGLLSSAIEVSSLFLDQGKPVVHVEERERPRQTSTSGGGFKTKKPLVVLIDNGSASASEITAGALQDYGRATIIGVKSFGKGSVQAIEDLSNGGAVKLTTAHYLTPKGRSIDKKGLKPDVEVPMDPRLQESEAKDVQLKRAVQVLRDKL